MPVRQVLTWPDERLKRVSAPVVVFDDALRLFCQDLEETMLSFPGCVGLAAPQVDRPERIVIVDVSSRPNTPHHGRLLLVNPEWTSTEGTATAVAREGCLSVPDFTGNVTRAEAIRLRYQTTTGENREIESTGYEARAIQHELDHLDGTLFLDRLVSPRELFRRKVYRGDPKGGSRG